MKTNKSKRKLLTVLSVGAVGSVAGLPQQWSKPLINAVVLPAHAQMTIVNPPNPTTTAAPTTTSAPANTCTLNFQSTGPIEANPFGATNCNDACNAHAQQLNYKLCSIIEETRLGKIECSCFMDSMKPYTL